MIVDFSIDGLIAVAFIYIFVISHICIVGGCDCRDDRALLPPGAPATKYQ